ncbi:MAG: hypothetical protein VCC01_09880, partial [Candidatus Hydrogenedentota bacterium]
MTQSTLYTTDNIVATVGVPSTSPSTPSPTGPIQYEYTWTTGDGQKTVIHTHENDVDTLDSNETAKHEIWACTVRAHDGVSYSYGSDSDTAPAILNTPPQAPVMSIPSVQSTSQNLIANITSVSGDADGDLSQYDFDWYRKPLGGSYSLFQDGGLFPFISSQINLTDTVTDDEWYVVVTPHDGEEFGTPFTSIGTPTTIVQGGVTPSFISLAASPTRITLGNQMTASGQIFPQPLGTETVTFTSVDPDGNTVLNLPTGAPTPNGIYSTLFTPNQATVGRSDWSMTATWDGDNTYTAAMSTSVSYTVLKAQPTLSVSMSISSGALPVSNLTTTVVLDAPLPGSLVTLLDGRSVELFVRKPDLTSAPSVTVATALNGTTGKYEAVFTPSDFASAGVVFDEAGTWKFQAQFSGNLNLLPQVTANFDDTDARLTVKDGAGYAILVVGSLDDSTNIGNPGLGEGQFEHTKTMDFVYSTFRDRGFAAEDIFYLREPTGQTLPSGIPTANLDKTPSQADFMTAITTWAQGKMNAAPAPLYIVMLDHGFPDEFFLFDPNNSSPFGDKRVVTPEEMDGWLTTLEGSLDGIRDDGTPDEAADQDLVIVYGACYSGSFIDDDPGVTGVDSISGTGRIIVTSSQADELSHRGAVDAADGIRDGELFTTEFFRELRAGYNMKVAFETASARVADFTLSRSNGGDPNAVPEQQPLLDDNGDAMGTLAAQLSVNPGDDGAIAFELELGFGESNPAGSVGLLQVTPTTALSLNESLPQLFAKATDATTLHEAWIEVKVPDYVGSSASDVTQTSGGGEDLSLFQREVLMFQFDSDQNNSGNMTPPGSGDYTFTDTLQDRTSTVSLASLMGGSGTY